MSSQNKTPKQIKLNERNHVEKPLLDQLAGLGWEVIDLTGRKQTPADTHRESYIWVMMPQVLRERRRVTNSLKDNHVKWRHAIAWMSQTYRGAYIGRTQITR
ncbi:MAG: hypothetical protein OXU79_19755 [Gemmatimonadota bacterium]|nr:hypothetical protein [Gemmatimonadota bacterium]